MQAQRYGYTQMINNATLTNSSYKMRLAQDITLYLAEIGMDIAGWDDEIGKTAWLEGAAALSTLGPHGKAQGNVLRATARLIWGDGPEAT